MKTQLKEYDSDLYFLSHNIDNKKGYELLLKLITKYKMNDQTLTELIKELNTIIPLDEKVELRIDNIIDVSLNHLKDASNLMEYFNNNEKDLIFLTKIFEQRINNKHQEDLMHIANDIFSNNKFKDILDKIEVNTLIKMILSTKDISKNYLIENILYSEKINMLEIDNLKNAVISLIKDKTYEEILDELILKHITNLDLLVHLKSDMLISKNKDVQIKGGVTDIYDKLYYREIKRKTYGMRDKNKDVLEQYDQSVLKSFVDTIDKPYINLTYVQNQNLDIVGSLLSIDKKERAEDIFVKSNYRPINKTRRAVEFKKDQNIIKDFDRRLNTNIHICITKGFYDILLTIISSKKIDSLQIDMLKYIISEMTYAINYYTDGEAELCQSVIDMFLLRISTNKLIIYRNTPDHILTKDSALEYINILINNPNKDVDNLLEQMKWTKKK